MSAPTTYNPDVAEPEGNAHSPDFLVYRPMPVALPRKQPLWQRFFMFIGIAATMVLTASGSIALFNYWAESSVTLPSSTYDMKLEVNGEPAYRTCQPGTVKDGNHQCVDEAIYEEVKAKATKQFKATMRDGEADFTRWVEKKGLKPALSSSRSAITLSYLCSVKPTQNGRLYAANSLGVKDSIDTFFADNNVMVAVGWNSATEIAQEWCPTVPSWAKPSPPKLSAPPSLAPQPSAPTPGENIKPPPDEAGYGG